MALGRLSRNNELRDDIEILARLRFGPCVAARIQGLQFHASLQHGMATVACDVALPALQENWFDLRSIRFKIKRGTGAGGFRFLGESRCKRQKLRMQTAFYKRKTI